jgi:hypothetical protein
MGHDMECSLLDAVDAPNAVHTRAAMLLSTPYIGSKSFA